MFLVGNAAFRKRFPRVSYRTEVPFIVGGAITFGLITWLHYSSYSQCIIFIFGIMAKFCVVEAGCN